MALINKRYLIHCLISGSKVRLLVAPPNFLNYVN